MTTTAKIYLDPNQAYFELIDTKEKNEIFLSIQNKHLIKLGTYTTQNSKIATKNALLEMKNNNQL